MTDSRILFREEEFRGDFFILVRPLLSLPGALLFDSCDGFGTLSRWSILAFQPFASISARHDACSISCGRDVRRFKANPFDALRERLALWALPYESLPFPFAGGAAGLFGYDLSQSLERLPPPAKKRDDFADLFLSFYDRALCFDHVGRRLYYCVSDPLNEGGTVLGRKLDRLIEDVSAAETASQRIPAGTVTLKAGELRSNFTRDEYCRAVERALRYIRDGDIYQVNLSQAFEFDFEGDPVAFYTRLRTASPAPFAAFMNAGGRHILSSSPERFLRVNGRHIETRPIKGTRPRGRTPEGDARLRDELLGSAKDLAELTMIVDLERNDLGRVAEIGTVKVRELPVLESFRTVHHLVATVEAEFRSGLGPVDLLKAAFPGGSITGAPKIRAMEIIRELEPSSRSVYTGSLAWLSFQGGLDSNILIRTVTLEGRGGRFQVGGGIVADSTPDNEYEETLHKAEGILRSLGIRENLLYG